MAKQKLSSADPKRFASWFAKMGAKKSLRLVYGKETGICAIIKKANFDAKRHTPTQKAIQFALKARKQGYVLSDDGKYIVLRTHGFWKDYTGKSASGVGSRASTRIGLRERLVKALHAKGGKASHKWKTKRVVKSISQLRNAIARNKGRKVKTEKSGKKSKKGKKGSSKNLDKLMKEEEE